MNEKENSFGMSLIAENEKLPVESLKFNRQYQRATQAARKERVKQSIIKCGRYLEDQPITVNQDGEVVDGQHRVLAVMELKITHIPATIYHFSDKEKEAAFFVHINGFDQRLSQIDYWYGRFLSGCPLARFMYFLEKSHESLLRNKIVVKGADTKTKMTVTQTLEVILHCSGQRAGVWKSKKEDLYIKNILKIGEKSMLIRINNFMTWVEKIYGTKVENPDAYRRDSMRAIMLVHNRLSDMGIESTPVVMKKLKTFNMNTTFVAAPIVGKKYQLIDHFNKGRQKNKIPYNLEKE